MPCFKDGDLALKVRTQLARVDHVYLTPAADQPLAAAGHVTITLPPIGPRISTNISEDAAVTIFYSSALETGIREVLSPGRGILPVFLLCLVRFIGKLFQI